MGEEWTLKKGPVKRDQKGINDGSFKRGKKNRGLLPSDTA
jgi:hypothetical protein